VIFGGKEKAIHAVDRAPLTNNPNSNPTASAVTISLMWKSEPSMSAPNDTGAGNLLSFD
jgi:hypothetical protein